METWIFVSKYILATALLMMLYWWALRHKASYRFNRHYLLLIPLLSLSMAIMHFNITVNVPARYYWEPASALARVNEPTSKGGHNTEKLSSEKRKGKAETHKKNAVDKGAEKHDTEKVKEGVKLKEAETPDNDIKTVETLSVMTDESFLAFTPTPSMGWGFC